MGTTAYEEFQEVMRDKSQRTSHPEDDHDNDARSFLNLSDDEDDATPTALYADRTEAPFPSTSPPASSRPSLNLSRNTIPTTRFEANTGPKGVIADAQHFQDSRRNHRVSMRNLALTQAQALSLAEAQPPPLTAPPVGGFDEEDLYQYDDEIDENGELDDDFMEKWRQSRLAELQQRARDAKMRKKKGHLGSNRGHMLGSLAPVDGAGYLNAVDNAPPDATVMVYIYDDMVSLATGHWPRDVLCWEIGVRLMKHGVQSEVSIALEDCLRDLAAKHINARFVKMHYQDAHMEPAGVPALLAYRGGEKFAGLVPLIHELPDDADLSATTLETVLKRYVTATLNF